MNSLWVIMLFLLQQMKLLQSFTFPILHAVPQHTAMEWAVRQRHLSQSVAVARTHRQNPARSLRIAPRPRPLHATAPAETNDQPNNDIVQSSALISQLQLCIPTVEEMQELGALVASTIFSDNAAARRPPPPHGSVVCLHGDIGAGKTVFAAGFVTFATGVTRVTSPTYLLSNTYRVNAGGNAEPNDDDDLEIHHLDLYRLSGPTDLAPLNLPHVFSNCISLIEWPSRLEDLMPSNRLDIYIRWQHLGDNEQRQSTDKQVRIDDDSTETTIEDSNISRLVTMEAHGSHWTERLQSLVDEGYVDDWVAGGSTEKP